MSAGRGAGGPAPAPPRGRHRPPPPPPRRKRTGRGLAFPRVGASTCGRRESRPLPEGEDRRGLSGPPASRCGARRRGPGTFPVGRRECGGWRRRRRRTRWAANLCRASGGAWRCLGRRGALRVDAVGREHPRPGQRVASGVRTRRLRSARDAFPFSREPVVLKSGPSGPGEQPCFLHLSCEPGGGEEVVAVGLLSSARNMEVYVGEEYCGTSRGKAVCGDPGDRSVSAGLSELRCCWRVAWRGPVPEQWESPLSVRETVRAPRPRRSGWRRPAP